MSGPESRSGGQNLNLRLGSDPRSGPDSGDEV